MKICILGCGNMMSAIIKPMAAKFRNLDFSTFTPSFTRADDLAQAIGGTAYNNIKDIPECDVYFIGCKPQQVSELSKRINIKDKVLVSILAGINAEVLSDLFNTKKVLRVMPNTPSLVGKGVSLIYETKEFSNMANMSSLSKNWLKTTGAVIEMESEKSLDEITLISGSGPAYVFKLANALFKKCIDLGLDENTSRLLVDNLLTGSSDLMKSEESLTYLEQIAKVCSKGGVTERAIASLENQNFDSLISDAIDDGIKHYEVLSKI